ncbi:MAG: hypothetical protein LBC02_11940 [Planctomycetaceae bacterium]|nr:hypothetical protein [Planctomycetaceae bacterium]
MIVLPEDTYIALLKAGELAVNSDFDGKLDDGMCVIVLATQRNRLMRKRSLIPLIVINETSKHSGILRYRLM